MDRITRIFSRGSPQSKAAKEDPNALWLYVQCGRCGTPLAVRIDRRNEISRDYESGGMVLKKEMMDGTCFQLMNAEVHFGERGEIKSQTVERGKFLTRDEYEALRRERK